ncbi:DUF2312 domain-containing protein [Pseudovibrio exalbescens]|uniref:DUF2312 domain-containing protein n=1 Tax=Pseudovibrio exalbescens TaxID=197461 RepID=UPI000C9C3FBF|nr:DUF2312 domain-containing protein [Pseudovibrio exalbescens]
MTEVSGIAADQLRAFVERVERLDEEITSFNDDKKAVYAEAKSNGFCVKTLKKIIQERRKKPQEREEQEALFDLYWHALQGGGATDAST